MNGIATITVENNHLIVSGDLNFSTVMNLWQQSLPLFSSCKELHFDLSQVNTSNSVALALLIEWIKYAKKSTKAIKFSNIPNQLNLIATAAGIEKMLG